MNPNEFLRVVRDNSLDSVYCFIGNEEWLKQNALQTLKKRILPEGLEELNEMSFDAPSLSQIMDAAQTLPVMCERRLVVAIDFPLLSAKKGKDSKKELERFKEWLALPNDTCVTVFYVHGTIESKTILALLEKYAQIVRFETLTESEILKWCNRLLSPFGKTIEPMAVQELVLRAGKDLTTLSGELSKLIAFVGEEKIIHTADVETIVSRSLEFRVFEMFNTLMTSTFSNANVQLASLLQNGEKPVSILSMITRQIRQMCHMRIALDAGFPAQGLKEPLHLVERAVFPVSKQAKLLPASDWKEIYSKCIDLDYSVKSGQMRDIDALQSAMLNITSRRDKVRIGTH